MKILLAVIAAFCAHASFLLFGGALFTGLAKKADGLQQVGLFVEDDTVEKEKEPDEVVPEEEVEELEAETEEPPDAAEVIRNLESSPTDSTPALEAASLSAIEAALSGLGGAGGDFAQSLDFASGGRIGGTGRGGSLDEDLDAAFSLAEIDQKPRPIFQAAPIYPAEMRSKKAEGVVSVLFVVDATGKVQNARVDTSSNVSFEKPALDAVRKWKFEPGLRAGQRVACKMRVPIRFQPS
jgi:protein TonB